jgi:hypothetical protein
VRLVDAFCSHFAGSRPFGLLGRWLALGLVLLLIGLLVLEGMKWMEKRRRQDRRATLAVAMKQEGPIDEKVADLLSQAGYETGTWAASYNQTDSSLALWIDATLACFSSRCKATRFSASSRPRARGAQRRLEFQ